MRFLSSMQNGKTIGKRAKAVAADTVSATAFVFLERETGKHTANSAVLLPAPFLS
jgi:hypothetical protein